MSSADSAAPDLEPLLQYLRPTRGFDFTGYKRASLARRVGIRMRAVHVETYPEYVDFLAGHPDEFTALFDTILINATRFFRDESAWDVLASDAIPKLLASRPAGSPIRVWSAGCASGEEAYSVAMLLAEHFGAEAFRDRVKVYATDVDDDALARARRATYSEREAAHVPAPLLQKYFERHERGTFTVRKDLRRQVIFGRHDLLQDAPISHVDLLVCRNTLMYFDAETQARVLARFHFALNDGGFLFLGRAETLLAQANVFAPVDVKRRISAKLSRGKLAPRDRLRLLAQQAHADDVRWLDVQVLPPAGGTSPLGASVSFSDVTTARRLQQGVGLANRELEAAYEQLHSTAALLATAREELRSTVEELATMSEELRSTNQELETMNAELQSVHHELHTLEGELRLRRDAARPAASPGAEPRGNGDHR